MPRRSPRFRRRPSMGAWSAAEGGLTAIGGRSSRIRRPSCTTTLRAGDAQVGLYVGYYRNQSSEQKLVSSENVLVKSHRARLDAVGGGSRPLDVDGHARRRPHGGARGGPGRAARRLVLVLDRRPADCERRVGQGLHRARRGSRAAATTRRSSSSTPEGAARRGRSGARRVRARRGARASKRCWPQTRARR